jgi:ferric-dicitrate binding protein FerR (iron transport regulator)
MDDQIEHIIFSSELSADQFDELRRAIASDAGLADLYRRWQDLHATVRNDLHEEMGDPRLFVLLALYHGGHADQLTADEISVAVDGIDQFANVLRDRPALALIAADIVEAASRFSNMWDATVNEETLSESILFEERSTAAAPADEKSDAGRRSRNRTRRPALRAARRPTHRTSAVRWTVRIAIGVSVVVFAFVLTQVLQRENAMMTVETSEGETTMVELSEGSRVRLLESSKLSYPHPESLTPLIRQAEIEGRAYFEIAPDERGFIVKTSNARVTVLGTTFGIESRNRITEVVLTEGRLTLSSEARISDFVLLEPGQLSRVSADGAPIEPIDVDVSERLVWTGLFIFKSTPMRTISERLSGHFGIPITVDQSLVDERVTGTFEQNQPLQAILDVIADAIGASVQKNPSGGYLLTLP